MTVAQLPLALLAMLLILAAISDARVRIIPNRLNLAIALIAPLYWWAAAVSGNAIMLHLAFAVGALALFGALFAIGMMGGGDVKLITALALWLPPTAMLTMLVWMAIAGGVLTIAMLVIHVIRRRPGRPEIPYGLAIVAATFAVLANDILTTSAA
jgi:prepilin peptidase CpaA